MSGVRSVAVLGLQAAGKTTFITAFFVACERGVEDMEITQYAEGDREYLNRLADALSDCTPLERTSQTQPGELRLVVRLAAEQQEEHELLIPDLSGELLRESMSDRALDPDVDGLVNSIDSWLLFVRVDKIVPAQRLTDFAAAMQAAGEVLTGSAAPEAVDDWSIELAATQVRLTDIVQELLDLGARPTRLGIVLSAWDKRVVSEQSPEDWADEHLPLLIQVLKGEQLDWTVFGVSAQGGDFDDPEVVARLAEQELASRPLVHSASGAEAGIGDPVKWALQTSPP